MDKFRQFIIDYHKDTDRRIFWAITVFTAILIYLNYVYGLERFLIKTLSFQLPGYYTLFAGAFIISYFISTAFSGKKYFSSPGFWGLIITGPLIFALKANHSVPTGFFENNAGGNYWNAVVYWPVRLLFVVFVLYLIYKASDNNSSFFGLTTRNFIAKPYFSILLLLIPLIVFASTQQDFLNTYPKLKNVTDYTSTVHPSWFYNLLYELSYGSDFISIELFFRGFLIFAFVQYAGKDAILPMACFYCTIHFGKPLFECISSFPGGLLLGIISYNTRSVSGGLIVHLGLAWMMELGGYLGNLV